MYERRTPVGGGVELSEQVIQLILRKLDAIESKQTEINDKLNAHLQEYAQQKGKLVVKEQQFDCLLREHGEHRAAAANQKGKIEGAEKVAGWVWAIGGGAVSFVLPYIIKIVFR